MAGSYSHCVGDHGEFLAEESLLDDLGDAYEALEEMYGMIWWLAAGAPDLVELARQKYMEGIALSPTNAGKAGERAGG